jgi:acetyl esterase/lipase
MSITSKIVCRLFTGNDKKRDAGLSTPDGIIRYDDIVYGENARWQTLDVYRPRQAEGKLPVIISVHGGGWVYGDKERYQYYCMDLAQRGFAVINFTYRLAPKYKYPAQLEDTCKVFRWVSDNADKYDFDMDALFAVGDSAGGHLLALYCIACTNESYAAHYDFDIPAHLLPKAVALNCGVYEVIKEGLTGKLIRDLMPKKGTEEELQLISPVRHLNSSFPPSYIMTAEKDFLKDDAMKLHSILDDLGVCNEYHLYDDHDHTLGHVFHLNIRLEDAKNCNNEECDFFRKIQKRK